MPVGLEIVGASRSGRPLFLFDGDDLAAWDVPASAGFEQFTAFFALDADRSTAQEITALGERLRAAGLVYVCAWGPGSGQVDIIFDRVFIAEEQLGIQRSFLMTDAHEDEPLAYGLWWALGALGEDVKDLRRSAVVIGTDREDWRREIRSWLSDVEELNRHVVEDLPD
jgi:hypothetical protein